jgi:alpha-beta hydrolase superfamily lysophospholipase/SAM-dependent methyltransferase
MIDTTSGARAPSATRRPCRENTFASFDATRLFYRHWPAAPGNGRKKAIVLFHRGHEHGGRIAHLVDELDLAEFAFFAWDARGLGRSPGERGYADSFGALVKDVDAFVQHIAREYGIALEDIAVIGQSVGAVLVATWVHDYAPGIRAMVLASPAFKVKLYVPLARPGLALAQMLRKKMFLNSYVKAKFLTHDAERIASYNTDPLIARPIAVNILLGLYDAAERVIADAAAINVPAQLLISGADWVVHRHPQHAFFQRLGSTVKESHVFDGFYHDTLGEKDRALALARARAFLLRQFSAPAVQPDLLHADRHGVMKDEFDRLSRPPASRMARLYWAMARFWIRVGGTLSEGIKISLDTGFDSGSTLDYVYRNQARGRALVGKWVDRIYLDSIGWRGIRVRKVHLERTIGSAIDRLKAAGQAVRIVDIAAGHGRYILEALTRAQSHAGHILLRDYSPLNVEAGRRLIAEKGMQAVAQFVQGDAFDRASLAALTPAPTLAVVSGLYELFPDNDKIRASLAGLADAVASGGYLIYTNQPWHPQLELIARSLTSHRQGQAWVMRRRSQAEMDQLVAEAGFEKLDQLTDEWGIFSVTLARRK